MAIDTDPSRQVRPHALRTQSEGALGPGDETGASATGPATPARYLLRPERVMACLESAQASEAIVYAGAGLAQTLGASLFVVHVSAPPADAVPGMATVDTERLSPALALAQRLGAGIVTIRASEPGAGLSAFAQREGITHALFGPEAEIGSAWHRSTLETFGQQHANTQTAVVRSRAEADMEPEEGETAGRWAVVLDAPRLVPIPSARAQSLAILGATVAACTAIGAILLLPAIVGFSLAVGSALVWGTWLDEQRVR